MVGAELGTKIELKYEGELNFRACAAIDAIMDKDGKWFGNAKGGSTVSLKESTIRGVLGWLSNQSVGGLMFMGGYNWISPTIGGNGHFHFWAAHSSKIYFQRNKKLVKVEAWSQNNDILSGIKFTFQ